MKSFLIKLLSALIIFVSSAYFYNFKSYAAPAVGDTWSYNYTGTSQSFTVPISGTYRITLKGARGGNGVLVFEDSSRSSKYGYGSTVTADVKLKSGKTYYVYVGGVGSDGGAGGFNGGGAGLSQQTISKTITDEDDDRISTSFTFYTGGGGGATDIRSSSALSSRILVAGGGGGGSVSAYNGKIVQSTGNIDIHSGGHATTINSEKSNGVIGQGSNGRNYGPLYESDGNYGGYNDRYPLAGGGGGGYYGGAVEQSGGQNAVGYNGTSYYDTSICNNFSYSVNNSGNGSASIKLIEIDEYVVQYKGNGSTGGSMSNVSTEMEYNHTILDNKYTRTGYLFNGWNTAANGSGTSYSPGAVYTAKKDMVLYAQWKPITYNVNIYKNQPADATSAVQYSGGTDWTDKNTYYTKQFTYDSTALPATSYFRLKGWTVNDKWYTSVNGTNGGVTGTAYASETKNLTATNNATVNLYAGWTKNKYTIVYSGNNTANNIYGDQVTTSFTGTTASTSCQYDTNVTLAKNGFSKEGYQFKEWNTKSDGTGTSYDQGQTLTKPNFVVTNNGSITLYAIWEPIRYTISFENNKGTHHTGSSDRDSTYRMSSVIDVRYDQYVTLPSNEYIRKYYVTLKNAEPWLTDLQAINGNTNSASAWVEYSFLGWKQGNALVDSKLIS